MALADNYLDAIKGFEGFTPQAQWDVRQHSNGYGTRAAFPGETIDQPEADRRFRSEIGNASDTVSGAFPDLPEGHHAALTSLTYNAGPGWINSGLGDALRRGDTNTAAAHFLQYNRADGQYNEGLANRRAQEAAWFDASGGPISSAFKGNKSMADPNQLPPALSAQFMAGGPGALFGAPGGVAGGDAPQGPGGYDIGHHGQNAAAWLMALDTKGASLGALKTNQDDFSHVAGSDGSIYRMNKKTGQITPVVGPSPKVIEGEADMFGNKPKLVQTGKNIQSLGDYLKAGGLAPASGPNATPSGSAADFDAIQAARQAGAPEADLYKMVPTQARDLVKGLIEGREIPANMGRGPAKMALEAYAHAIDPTFDATKVPGRIQYQKQLAMDGPTTAGGQRILLGTALGHLADYGNLATKAGNADTGIEPATVLVNRARGIQGGGEGSPADVYNQMTDAAAKHAGEVGKLYSGAQGGGIHEREATEKRMGVHASPSVIAGQLENSRALVLSRLSELQRQADEQMGPGRVQMQTPQVKEYIAKLDAQIASLRGQKNDPPNPFTPPPLSSFHTK